MALVYPNWAYDPKFNSIFNRKVQHDIDDYVFRHPTEILLTLAKVRASGGPLATLESLGELFCLMDDLVDFRTTCAGPALKAPKHSRARRARPSRLQRQRSKAAA